MHKKWIYRRKWCIPHRCYFSSYFKHVVTFPMLMSTHPNIKCQDMRHFQFSWSQHEEWPTLSNFTRTRPTFPRIPDLLVLSSSNILVSILTKNSLSLTKKTTSFIPGPTAPLSITFDSASFTDSFCTSSSISFTIEESPTLSQLVALFVPYRFSSFRSFQTSVQHVQCWCLCPWNLRSLDFRLSQLRFKSYKRSHHQNIRNLI